MNKQEKKMLLITTLLCLCPMILGILMLPKLPNEIAIHFDVNNNPDNYASKEFFVFFFPIFMAITHFICIVMTNKQDKEKIANKKMNQLVQWIFPVVSIVMYNVTLMIALEYPVDIRIVVMLLLGILFIIMGNYLPKTKKSSHINLGFKKNLDDITYKKVARASGYGMIIDGLLMIVSIFFSPMASVYLVGLILLEGVVLSVYTFKKSYTK